MRASLFNLVVFNRISDRTDYFRNIVDAIVKKFPCRTLFISEDPSAETPYLKTAISVTMPQFEENIKFACDQIDIGASSSELHRAEFLLLPHLIPDLPVYLLWGADPGEPHPLFLPLSSLATRIIYDSESANNLLRFAENLLKPQSRPQGFADLNWARMEGWRDLIASSFNDLEHQAMLKNISFVKIVYNAKETEFFCHLKVQAMYLLAWLASRLEWKLETSARQTPTALFFQFASLDARIVAEKQEDLGAGSLLSVELHTKDGHLFSAARVAKQRHLVKIHFSSEEKCELPYPFILGKSALGQSLVKEVCTRGTSAHFQEALKTLLVLDKECLC